MFAPPPSKRVREEGERDKDPGKTISLVNGVGASSWPTPSSSSPSRLKRPRESNDPPLAVKQGADQGRFMVVEVGRGWCCGINDHDTD